MPIKIQELVIQVKVHEERSKNPKEVNPIQNGHIVESEYIMNNLSDNFLDLLKKREER